MNNESDAETDVSMVEVKQEESQMDRVEYVAEQLDVNGSSMEAFSEVFARFKLPAEETAVRLLFLY